MNVSKTQMIVLSRRCRAAETKEINVTLRNKAIVRSTKIKYLGVWIDDELKWSEHNAAVRRRCLLGLSKLRRVRDVLPVNITKTVYNALVMPHLDYCTVARMLSEAPTEVATCTKLWYETYSTVYALIFRQRNCQETNVI